MDAPAAYWRAKLGEVVLFTLVGIVLAVPAIVEAWDSPEVVAWRERVKACEGCAARRLKLRRFIRAYDRAEAEVQHEAEVVVRRAARSREHEGTEDA